MQRQSGGDVVTLNYTSHAVDDLIAYGNWFQVHGSNAQVESLPLLGRAITLLRTAEKFLLPHDAELLSFNEVTDKYRDLVHLPYPVVVLEFATSPHRNGGSTKAIVLAWHAAEDLPPEAMKEFDVLERPQVIAFTSFFYSIRQKAWIPSPHVFWFHKDHLALNAGRIETGINKGLMYEDLHGDMWATMSEQQREQEEDGNLKVGMDALLEFTVTVNCENVSRSQIEPSKVLNQKRKSKLKEPFYSYKLLTIPGAGPDGGSGGGAHASPRMHLRRGHLRRLQSGKVAWVRHTIVGNAELGQVEKTYQVQT